MSSDFCKSMECEGKKEAFVAHSVYALNGSSDETPKLTYKRARANELRLLLDVISIRFCFLRSNFSKRFISQL